MENFGNGGIARAVIFVVISFGIARAEVAVAFEACLLRAVVRGIEGGLIALLLIAGGLIAVLLRKGVLLLIGILLIIIALAL